MNTVPLCEHGIIIGSINPCTICNRSRFFNAILNYIQELERTGIPYVSYSHVTLRHLWEEYGESRVNNFLTEYWR